MMGTAMYTLDIPVQKTSSSILAFEKDPVAEKPVQPLHPLRAVRTGLPGASGSSDDAGCGGQ